MKRRKSNDKIMNISRESSFINSFQEEEDDDEDEGSKFDYIFHPLNIITAHHVDNSSSSNQCYSYNISPSARRRKNGILLRFSLICKLILSPKAPSS